MGKQIEEVDVKKEGKVIGQANVAVFTADQEGLKEAIEYFGQGDQGEGVSRCIGFINAAHRVAEAGKVRGGTDPMKAAKTAASKLTKEQLSQLMAELSD
jgi:hypothetical protein